MEAVFLGFICIFGVIGAALVLLLASGIISLTILWFKALDPEERRDLARPMLLLTSTSLGIIVIGVLFALRNLTAFFGAFPLP